MVQAGRVGLLLASTLLMAGCAGGDDGFIAEQAGPGATVQANVESLPDAGTIVGTVTDDALVPIPNAQVALLKTDIRAQADANGYFQITNLAPGDYDVAAAALGFSSIVKRVTVLANAETPLSIILTTIAMPGAEYVEVIGPFTFYFDIRVGTPAVTGGAGPNDKSSQNFTMTEDVHDFVGELAWEQGSFATSKALRMSFSYNGRPNTHWYCTDTSASPISWRYNLIDALEGSPADGCKNEAYCGIGSSQGLSGDHKYPTVDDELIAYVNTPFGCTDDPTHAIELALQQRLTGMLTISHNHDLPEVYTAFPDA